MLAGVESGRQRFYYNEQILIDYFSDFIGGLLLQKANRVQAKYLSEKTPDNILVFSWLLKLFPKSKYIWIVRDPRANINSFVKVNKRAQKYDYPVSLGNNIFKDLKRINISIKKGQEFYYKNTGRCFLIHFENLVRYPEREIRKVCDFLEIKYSSKMMETNKPTDSSALIENRTVRAWFTKEMFDRTIEKNIALEWQNELNTTLKNIANKYFLKKNYPCYRIYDFEKPSRLDELKTFLYRLKFSIKYIFLNRK